jgi:hypothetical protein
MKRIPFILAFFLSLGLGLSVRAAEEGVHASLIVDEDGDDAILMESEWISMHLLPWRQALINRFVFTPTGNDIVETTNPKDRFAGGGGILMDCLWEQDWRFQELGYKAYKYTVLKNGPDEAKVAFETDIIGWLGMNNSGIISKLLSDLTMRRTVTLKRGQPFFRFDIEFINKGRYAKRPTFWVHNASHITAKADKKAYYGQKTTDTMIRPTARGLSAIGKNQEAFPAVPRGEHFLDDFNAGWTANINSERREGIVYLMDYDSVDKLYNSGTQTTEWFYNGILVPKSNPWRGTVYILPTIGLTHVSYANEYFIVQLDTQREEGQLTCTFRATSSYEKAAQVTFNTSVESNLLEGKPRTVSLDSVTLDALAIQPSKASVTLPMSEEDPLALDISAVVELPNGTVKTFSFQKWHIGHYKLKGNERNAANNNKPIKLFRRKVQNPKLPPLPATLALNTKDLKVFGIFGQGSYRLGLEKAVRTIPNASIEIGYCSGNDPAQAGLSDFPYDYDRMFDHRVMLLSNLQDKEFRRIGASVMLPWLKAGGGLVISGGNHAFTFEYESHEINERYPFKPKKYHIKKGAVQLSKPLVPDHPVFRGVDLSSLPWLHFHSQVELKEGTDAKVLMKAGDYPFIVEKRVGNQITMVTTANAFGSAAVFPGKPLLLEWKEWPTLYANLVRYAAGELK